MKTSWLRISLRGGLPLLAAFVMASRFPVTFAQASDRLPQVVSAGLPIPQGFAAVFEGEATLHVTTAGRRVDTVSVVSETSPLVPVPGKPSFTASAAEEFVRTWAFADDRVASFDFAYRHHISHNKHCGTEPPEISMTLPTLVDVTTSVMTICDGGAYPMKEGGSTSAMRGKVRCECPGAAGIAGAFLQINSENRRVSRSVRTDADGNFEVHDLRDGRYAVLVSGGGYERQGFEVTLARASANVSLELGLSPEPPPAPATYDPFQFEVRRGATPLYPLEARARGLEGSATARVSFIPTMVSDVDVYGSDPIFVRAARTAVESWDLLQLSNASLALLQFRYHLIPGDCGPSRDETTVHLKFSDQIDVTAKRVQKCGPDSMAAAERRFATMLRPPRSW